MSGYTGLETQSYGLNCPNCGELLERTAFDGGRRLARCWHCGGLVRAQTRPRPVRTESENQGETGRLTGGFSLPRLETAQSYAPPHLQCPYCEHVNRELPQANSPSLYCSNCGAELKKLCLNCDRPMYVLDHFCPYCRTDQERAQYELETLLWQEYNEGKRLAKLGYWEPAHRHLSLFFNPDAIGADPVHAGRAQAVYRHSIAPEDGGEGLRLYNEALQRLRQRANEELKQEERRKQAKWGVVALLVGLLALWSAFSLGAWWAIFAIGFGVVIVLALLILFVLLSIGGGM